MLAQEGKLLQAITDRRKKSFGENGDPTESQIIDDEFDNYVVSLAEYLDRKQLMISKLQSQMVDFKKELAREQKLAQRGTTLAQY